MRFIRFMAITVLLLACVVLGSACAGAKGEQGPKGDTGAAGVGVQNIVNNGNGPFTVNLTNGTAYTTDNLTGPQGAKGDAGATGAAGAVGAQGIQGMQGIQGVQGEPGPNMIVPMGNIGYAGPIVQRYNVTSCTWDVSHNWYDLVLTGISYNLSSYVTLATTVAGGCTVHNIGSLDGHLFVQVRDGAGNPWQQAFSFMVLECP